MHRNKTSQQNNPTEPCSGPHINTLTKAEMIPLVRSQSHGVEPQCFSGRGTVPTHCWEVFLDNTMKHCNYTDGGQDSTDVVK